MCPSLSRTATQDEINEEVHTILKCIVHSDDNYTRDVVDLNTVAFLERLGKMLRDSPESEPKGF